MASVGSPAGGVKETKKTPTVEIYKWEQGSSCWVALVVHCTTTEAVLLNYGVPLRRSYTPIQDGP